MEFYDDEEQCLTEKKQETDSQDLQKISDEYDPAIIRESVTIKCYLFIKAPQ